MINAVLVLPDHPGPVSFNPNSIKDLKAADPAANIDFIESAARRTHRAPRRLSFPIRLPTARGAYQPSLSLVYDSGGGERMGRRRLGPPDVERGSRHAFGVPVVRRHGALPARRRAARARRIAATCVDGSRRDALPRPRRARASAGSSAAARDPASYWFEVTDKRGNAVSSMGHEECAHASRVYARPPARRRRVVPRARRRPERQPDAVRVPSTDQPRRGTGCDQQAPRTSGSSIWRTSMYTGTLGRRREALGSWMWHRRVGALPVDCEQHGHGGPLRSARRDHLGADSASRRSLRRRLGSIRVR